ncbi:MAG: sigma 54-interacting transcriptional regulator [Acidobacteriota bacterium]|nr:sigma 54-interacting transcriptional regulator [Acidobacteriota bacterium]
MRPTDLPQKDAAAELKQDRAQFAHLIQEDLFEVTPDAIIATDTDGVIRAVNLRAEELFGHKRSELIGQSIELLVPQRFRENHFSFRTTFNERPQMRQMGADLFLFGQHKSGREIPVDIMLKPVATPDGPMVLSFVRDETERRRTQDRKRQADEELRAIVSSVSNHAIYMLDLEGRVRTWNPGAEQLKGYTAEEIIGENFAKFFTAEEVERGKPTELLRIASECGRLELEAWRVRKNGERFWANVVLTAIHDKEGRVCGFSKVVRDFTDKKRASDSLLLQLSSVLLASRELDALLEAISASLRDLIPHDCATLGMLDDTGQKMRVHFFGMDGDALRRGDLVNDLRGTPAEEAYRTGVPILIQDLNVSKFREGSLEHLTSIGMHSACCVPLFHLGTPLGTLAIASRRIKAFTTQDTQMLMEIGRQFSVAVFNAKQLKKLEDAREKLGQQKRYLEEEINLQNQFEDIVGESTGLRSVLQKIETVAPTDATVLIEGETGTGKELLARAIHRLSKRKRATFVKLNCAAIPSGLIESELFGHEKGAFTGAIQRKIGKLELANEGTLFLDEIGELPLELQPKLLRALQEKEIERLGSNQTIPLNVRLVAATNRNLERMVGEGKFRSDLYYRLKVFPIYAPPLRERASDIPGLVRHFVTMHSRSIGKKIEAIPDDVMRALEKSKWPGNIRELENFIERAVILTRGSTLQVPVAELRCDSDLVDGLVDSLETAEREHIVNVLRETDGQVGGKDGAAARLGLKRTTLHSKMNKLRIRKSDYMSSQ